MAIARYLPLLILLSIGGIPVYSFILISNFVLTSLITHPSSRTELVKDGGGGAGPPGFPKKIGNWLLGKNFHFN